MLLLPEIRDELEYDRNRLPITIIIIVIAHERVIVQCSARHRKHCHSLFNSQQLASDRPVEATTWMPSKSLSVQPMHSSHKALGCQIW